MIDDYILFNRVFGYSPNNSEEKNDKNDKNILNYRKDELYNLLVERGIAISSINQIMKLYEIKYPLDVSNIENYSTDELRNLVKSCKEAESLFKIIR